MIVNIFFTHHFEAISAVLCLPKCIHKNQFSPVFNGRLMHQFRLKPQFILKHILLVNTLCLYSLDVVVAVNHVDQTFISDLELTFQLSMILVWNQICLSQRCVWFQTELRRIHKRTKERHLAALL